MRCEEPSASVAADDARILCDNLFPLHAGSSRCLGVMKEVNTFDTYWIALPQTTTLFCYRTRFLNSKKQPATMVSMVSSYALTWKIFLASWQKDWKQQAKEISQLGALFHRVDTTPTLMWNVIMFNAVTAMLLYLADFSKEFQLFTLLWVELPCLAGSVGYYYYRFGSDVWKQLTFASLSLWLQNWITMQGIALTCLTQSAIIYGAGLLVEPHLPSYLQYSVTFPKETYEEYLPVCVYCFCGLFGILLFSLPVWRDGYNLSMKVAGRNVTISLSEICVELVYQTSQSSILIFSITAVIVNLQNWGFRLHLIHFMLATIEMLLINKVVQFKFCILHQLMHDIRPLYAMTHIEHHICRGIHPTSSAAGLWEFWLGGQGIFFTVQAFFSVPFVIFQGVYSGANVVVHTMWPSEKLMQWHTLHHTILADVYNVNVPSPYDREHSEAVKKYQSKLEGVSPFVRYEALSDLASFALMGVVGVFFHYVLGIGIGHVDWSKAEWVHHYSS
jgi:hypothetical protein